LEEEGKKTGQLYEENIKSSFVLDYIEEDFGTFGQQRSSRAFDRIRGDTKLCLSLNYKFKAYDLNSLKISIYIILRISMLYFKDISILTGHISDWHSQQRKKSL